MKDSGGYQTVGYGTGEGESGGSASPAEAPQSPVPDPGAASPETPEAALPQPVEAEVLEVSEAGVLVSVRTDSAGRLAPGDAVLVHLSPAEAETLELGEEVSLLLKNLTEQPGGIAAADGALWNAVG